MNKQAAQINNNALHRDAVKQLVVEALAQRPARTIELADRLGMDVTEEFMEILAEMEKAMEINFNWIRGYSV